MSRTAVSIAFFLGIACWACHESDPDAPNAAPVIVSLPSPSAMVGRPFQYRVSAFDPDLGSLTYALLFGPPGAAIDATGLVSWTPSSEGTFDFEVAVTDPGRGRTVQTFSVEVTSDPTQLIRTSPLSGEAAVALTRETILEFDRPVSRNLAPNAVQVLSAGEFLSFRPEFSPDSRRLTLFYADPLPPGATVQVLLQGDDLLDAGKTPIDGDGDGVPGGLGVVSFSTITTAPVAGTSVCGRVFASEFAGGTQGVNDPLVGVEIVVEGSDPEIKAVTGPMGNFRIDNAPAGRLFVLIDGKTAENPKPEGTYYPSVGKAFETVAGRETNVGEIFLPLVPPKTLIPVSPDRPTTIGFPAEVALAHPELLGTQLVVPPGSLFTDEGLRGGSVGIAPVPPDRIPGRLPEFLDFPVVFTVQTDGATNFAEPVAVRFPNLPDPTSGELLSAGEKTALWSFDHDVGAWAVAGSMTVTRDGRWIESDPGVGIRAPGWHGSRPGGQMDNDNDNDCPGADRQPFWWRFLRAALECLSDLTKSFRALNAIVQSIHDIIRLTDSVPELIDSLRNGSSCEAAQANLETLTAAKDIAVNVYNVLVSNDPIGKAIQAISCALALCQGITDEICENSMCSGLAMRQACGVVNGLKSFIENVQRAIQEARAPQLILGTLCSAIDDANMVLAEFCRPGVAVGGQPTLEDVVQALEAILEAADSLRQDEASYADIEGGLELVESEAHLGVDSLVVPFLVGDEGLANAYWHLRFGSSELDFRGRANAQGVVSIPVTANVAYDLAFFVPAEQGIARATGTTPPAGGQGKFGPFELDLLDADDLDSDADGLADAAEEIVGTSPDDIDSDNDDSTDGAEIANGTNPLDGFPVVTGVVGSAATRGYARDVFAQDELVLVPDSRGLSVFNVFNGMQPELVAQVDSTGNARDVALIGAKAVVADSSGGLLSIDLSAVPSPSIEWIARLGDVQCVAAVADVAIAGLANGRIAALDAATGGVLDELAGLGSSVQDIELLDDTLYVATLDTLHVVPWQPGALRVVRSLPLSGPATSGRRRRVFAEEGVLYAVHALGYDTYDVATDPHNPTLIQHGVTSARGWRHIVTNGDRIGVAAVGLNVDGSGPSEVELYDTSAPSMTDRFLTRFETPGTAEAIALYNGLAYVADGDGGLQVINYLAYDTGREPPVVSIQTSSAGPTIDEQSLLLVQADVSDDVQVRNVELLVDDVVMGTDGNHPYQFFLRAPALSQQSTVKVGVRASDTGGNRSTIDEVAFNVVPDSTSPELLLSQPSSGSSVFVGFGGFRLLFSEAMNESSIEEASLLVHSGIDDKFGSIDDSAIPVSFGFSNQSMQVLVRPDSSLPLGRARFTMDGGIATDLAGNPLDVNGDGTPGDLLEIIVRADDTEFFLSPGGDPRGDLSWEEAVGFDFLEEGFSGFNNDSIVDSIVVGATAIDIDLDGPGGFSEAIRVVAGAFGTNPNDQTTTGIALVDQACANCSPRGRITLNFATPVLGVGVWLFDDFGADLQFQLEIVDGTGARSVSEVLSSGFSSGVEGFIGAVSTDGITQFTVISLSNGVESNADFLWIDSLHVAQ